MDRAYFIKKIVLREYAKSVFVLAASLIFILSYLTSMTIEANKSEQKRNLQKRNSTLKNRLGNDIAGSLKWISIYNELGVLNDMLEGGPDGTHIEAIVTRFAQSSRSINEIASFDSKGKKIKKHYKNKEREGALNFPPKIREEYLEGGENRIFIDAKVLSPEKADFYFYAPVIEGHRIKGYIGISYGLDDFFHQFKGEFKEIFDTTNLGVLSKNGEKNTNFFSVDVGEDEIGDIFNARVKISSPFNLGGQLENKLSPYFDEVVLSPVFTKKGVLTSYIPREVLGFRNFHLARKYFIFVGMIFVVLAILLWLYIGERVQKIRNFKRLKTYNIKLRKTLETKDILFSIIGHDLRSPFTSQLGYFQMLQKKYDTYEREDIKKIIDIMSINSGKLSILTENILRWAAIHNKKIEYRPENLRLRDIIEEYEDIFKVQLASKDINLKVDVVEDSTVKSDKNLLEASLRNLISNAIKYSQKGGDINILAREEDEYISLSVEDNGTGIPEDIKPDVLKGNHVATAGTYNEKGIGLGLYIVREFTKVNKGRVYFQSEEGRGTKFTLLIPRA